jgi:RNA 2',3'-cyclic 3'-phosphodiesterase
VRLFVALEIPADVRGRLAALMDNLRTLAPHFKWVRAQNLHLTLKFLGEIDLAKLEAIRAALAGLRSMPEFELRYRGFGFFPNEKRPRVFWAGIDAGPELAKLATAIDGQAAKLGVPQEDRAFSAHLTLARLDGQILPVPFRDAFSKYAQEEFGTTRVMQFHLMESKLKSTGAEYTTLQSFALSPES